MGLSYPSFIASNDKENSTNMKREVTDPNDNVIGRRCAVYFELGPCFFRENETVKSGGGYFLGKVVDRRGKNKLTVRFDDSQESDYVHKEVRFIEPSSKNSNQLVLCDDPEKTIATLEPANLAAGDIVLANYDGENWFRGRVAFVNTSKGTCDVAYDDGEYQTGVNIRNHAILISRGADNPAWVAGLPVHFASASGPDKKGTVSDVIDNPARIKVTYEDMKTKAFPYLSIVLMIFLSVRKQPDRGILSWPAPRTTVVPPAIFRTKEKPRALATQAVATQKTEGNATTKTKSTAKPSQDKVETKRSSRSSPSRSSAHQNGRASRGSLNVSYADCDSDIDVDETDLLEYSPPAKSSGAGAKSKATRKELITVHDSESEDENFMAAPVARSTKISAAAKKTNATGKSLIDVESDSEDDIVVVAPRSKSNKTSDANKKRKAPPRRKDAMTELDSDTDVDTKKRKTPSVARVSRKGAPKSYCEDDLDESDLEEAEETDDERKGRPSAKSSSRNSSRNDSMVCDDKKTVGSKSIGRASQKRNPAIKIGPCQEPTYYDIATDVVEMGDSESEVYLSSLDSSESFVGNCFLTLTCMFHKRVPSAYHCKRLIDLLTFGPGNTPTSVFPDHTRMENAMKAFRLLVVQQGLADHIASGLHSEYVEKAMNQVSAPYYTIAGDERRCTSASLQRLGLSLHALACGMEVFEVLLKHQLRGCLGVTHPDDQYRSRPLVKQITEYPRQRTKGVLKQMAKEYVQFWCRYSHFISGSFRCPSEETHPELLEESFDFVRNQASRVATSLGRALSYMCCLYGADSSTRMESVGFEVGLIMKEVVDSNNFETSDLVSDQAQNIRLQGKVDMIVHLDETLIPDVLPTVAEALEVIDSFNTIYSLLAI